MWFLLANIEFMSLWKSIVDFCGILWGWDWEMILPAESCQQACISIIAAQLSGLIIWQYWIDWHHDRQRAAKKNTGSLYYLFAVRNLWGQWRQCLFSVIYRLVACPKNLFVNHEFKVGSESGRCCIIASTSLRLSDIRKKALNDERSLCACSKTPRLSKTIWTTVTNHIAIRTSALWDWYVRSEKSSQNHVKFVALSSMENMIPARC